MGGQQNGDHFRKTNAGSVDQLKAILSGHFNIAHQNINGHGLHNVHGALCAGSITDILNAQLLEVHLGGNAVQNAGLVIHKQYIHDFVPSPCSNSIQGAAPESAGR